LKRICTLLLSAAIMFFSAIPLGITASAETYIGSLLDYADCFTNDQEALIRDMLAHTAQTAGCNVGLVTADDLEGKSAMGYTEDILDSMFVTDSDSIVLMLNNDFDNEDHYDWISFTGAAADRYNDELGALYDSIYSQMETDGYIGAVIGYCNYLGLNKSDINDKLGQTENDSSIIEYKVVLNDMDDMLSASDEADLTERLHTAAQNIKCHVGIVITDDLEGMSDEEYAINFAKESFSYGSDLVVLLLNNDRSNDNYTDWIYTYGRGTDLFDPAIDGIFDTVYDGLGDYQENIADYDYHSGIINFCNALEDVSENGQNSYYYHSEDDYYDDGEDSIIVALGVPVIIAGIITAITVGCTASGYSKKKPISARHYMDVNRTRFLNRRDVYLRETTTSVKISSSSSGGGGSRGGGGGRSRSGGGGGGGRRR